MGDWKIIASAGSVTAPSIPDAPNVLSTSSVAAFYGLFGNASAYGFTGSIDLPTTDPDYAHMKKIHVLWTRGAHAVEIATLYGPWASSPQVWDSGADPQFLQDGSSHTDSIAFLCENDNGVIAGSPVTKSVTVRASAVTGFTSAAETGTRFVVPEDNDRLPHLTISFVPTLNGSQVPQVVPYGVSDDNGTSWTTIGWAKITTVGQSVSFTRVAPAVAGTWKVFAGPPGPLEYTPAKFTSLPSGAAVSSGFAVAAIAAPAASNGITATVGAFSSVQRKVGDYYGSIPAFTGTDPTSSANTDFYFRIVITELDASHNPISAQKVHDGWQIKGPGISHTTAQPLLITLRAGLAGIRYEVFLASKLSTGGGDFAISATNTLQNVAWNGGSPADHYDVMFGTLPDDAIPTQFLDPDTIGTQLTFRNGKLDGNSPFLAAGIINGNFEDWDSGVDPVGWVTAGSVVRDPTPFGVSAPSGQYSCTFFPHASLYPSVSTVDAYQCKPAEKYVLKATIRSGGSANADLYIFTAWADAAGSISYLVAPFTAAAYNGAFTDVVASLTVPAGKCYCQVIVNTSALLTVGYWSIDNLRVEKQVSTGQGTTPDGQGGVQLNTTDLTNAVLNSGFENGLDGWTLERGTWAIEGPYSGGSGSTVSGAYRLKVTTDGTASEITETTPHLVIPGQKWFAEANYATTGASNQLYMQLLDTDGATQIGSLVLLATGSATGSWDTLSAAYTVPAGVSFMRLWLKATVAAGYALFDAISLRRQVTYGPGLSPDGNGGVRVPLLGIDDTLLAAQSVIASKMAANAITAANNALAANSVVDGNVVSVGINKVTYGTSIFAGDVILSRGVSLPVIVLSNTGLNLFGQADASTGATGLTSLPNVAIQSSGLSLFSGSNTSVTVTSSAVTLWSVNGSTSNPYVAITSASATFASGSNSVVVTSSGITITQASGGTFTANSTGFSVSKSSNSVAVDASGITITQASGGTLTASSTGFTISKSSNSLGIDASGISITQASGASLVLNSTSLTLAKGTYSVVVSSSDVVISDGSHSISVSSAGIVLTNSGSGIKVTDGSGNNTLIAGVGVTCAQIIATQVSVGVGGLTCTGTVNLSGTFAGAYTGSFSGGFTGVLGGRTVTGGIVY